MKFIQPDFYEAFRCTAGACAHNCCLGWEVDVDPDTAAFYGGLEGALGEKMRRCMTVSPDGSRCFAMTGEERCPFLDADNLCEIYSALGHDALCDICREHPRFYREFPGRTERGLGLACEEVCRLLESGDRLTLVTVDDGADDGLTDRERDDADFYDEFCDFRADLFREIFDGGRSLRDTLGKAVVMTADWSLEQPLAARPLGEIARRYAATEPIDGAWERQAARLTRDARLHLPDAAYDAHYKKVFAYLIFRHLSRGFFDGRYVEVMRFCVEAVQYLRLWDGATLRETGALTADDLRESVRRWSQQVEYSAENTDALTYGE
ncbi:MAG: flagellin lysine-N-methylase [Clostridia bacterium]|nr:flagellin lysine-N-methylase [Clostridia bacterium]